MGTKYIVELHSNIGLELDDACLICHLQPLQPRTQQPHFISSQFLAHLVCMCIWCIHIHTHMGRLVTEQRKMSLDQSDPAFNIL